jgi:hypothetical protein
MHATRLAAVLIVATTTPLSAQTMSAAAPRRQQSMLRVVTFAGGGILVGAWSGYVTSQVTRSDWDDPTGRGAERLRFSLGGAALGLITGVILGTRGGGDEVAPVGPPRLPLPINRPLTTDEIRTSQARTITQLLREKRPQWLRARGRDVVTAIDANTSVHGTHGIVVYLNGTPLGGLESLDEVSIDAVTGIQFMDGPAAIVRYGTGNEDGAILLTTAAGL